MTLLRAMRFGGLALRRVLHRATRFGGPALCSFSEAGHLALVAIRIRELAGAMGDRDPSSLGPYSRESVAVICPGPASHRKATGAASFSTATNRATPGRSEDDAGSQARRAAERRPGDVPPNTVSWLRKRSLQGWSPTCQCPQLQEDRLDTSASRPGLGKVSRSGESTRFDEDHSRRRVVALPHAWVAV